MTMERQSIVHQVVRLQRRSVQLLSRLSNHSRGSRSNVSDLGGELDLPSEPIGSESMTRKSWPVASIPLNVHLKEASGPGDQFDPMSDDEDEFGLFVDDKATEHVESFSPDETEATEASSPSRTKKAYHGDYRTITQNEFFLECFENNNSYSIVHCYKTDDEESERYCQMLDRHLEEMALIHTGCKFLRMNGMAAPFFMSKLKVKSLPAVLALRNGVVVNCLSKFGNFGLFTGKRTIGTKNS